jgi:uncharacterized repeat protein (TIGR01451 family)
MMTRRAVACQLLVLLALLGAAAASADVSLVERGALQKRLGRGKAQRQNRTSGAQQLVDASGLRYLINTDITFSTSSSASGAVSNATYTHAVFASTASGSFVATTLANAFAGYNGLCLSLDNSVSSCTLDSPNFIIYNENGPASTECNGRQVVLPPQNLKSPTLQVSRKVFVPANDAFARWLNYFTNTGASPVTVTMVTSNDLGSGSQTKIVTSSNGNNVAETADTWVTTFQDYAGTISTEPRLGHVLQGPGAAVPLAGISFADGDGNPFWGYTFTLAPGQTRIVMNFVTGQPTKTAAADKAQELTTLPASALQCLSAAELAEIANFSALAASADLSIVKSGPASVTVGSPINYTLQVTNNGPAVANNVIVADTLPAGVSLVSAGGSGWGCSPGPVVNCTIASLPVGPAPAITIQVTAPATPGPLTNRATVAATTIDPTPGNDSSTVTTQVLPAPVTIIPTLGTLGLAALVLALGVSALAALRRRAG